MSLIRALRIFCSDLRGNLPRAEIQPAINIEDLEALRKGIGVIFGSHFNNKEVTGVAGSVRVRSSMYRDCYRERLVQQRQLVIQ